MTLEEILKSIDSKILTESVKSQLTEAFEKAIEDKTKEQLDTLIESIDTNINVIIDSKLHDFSEKADTAVEAKAKELMESETKILAESIDKYIEASVEKFVEDNKSTWEDEIKSYKADAIVESFAKMAGELGVEIQKIEHEDVDAKKLLDESLDNQRALKEEVFALKKAGLMFESCVNLTIKQQEKLQTLMESYKGTDIKEYEKQLNIFKETLVVESGGEFKTPKKEDKSTIDLDY